VLLDSLLLLKANSDCPPFRLEAAWATEAFRTAVAERGLQDRVESLGVLGGPERREWMMKLDIFALPSLAEGFPNVLMEMMASGVPVVASTVGAIPFIVEAGVEAELIPPGDARSLASALKNLLADPVLRKQRSDAGLAAVRERYSTDGGWDDVLVREYGRLLRGPSNSGSAQQD
jgi:glycosyltransferase involved in cell wall biosynthesis